ncbi:hypothetical protein FC83_GL000043 [Agrilactobacillus composti DSM 18527 = JCM 14202]|uniref:Uncharacterized protein n=1 Tax=Agrilactobacillus composti DSM 18527 = JCM 14202 TaxID=1423734 RepID=A0A0R1Y1B5_9LACO|nr:hypothetical protein FC83_GL000043 [Agrilactobacillus composti DSM 18527 = JCM 14202]
MDTGQPHLRADGWRWIVARLWRILPTEIKIMMRSGGGFLPGTFAALLALAYGAFLALYWYVFVANLQDLHLNSQQIFNVKVLFFAMYLLFIGEAVMSYVSIDNEGAIFEHNQVIRNFIQTKIQLKYLISTLFVFANTLLLIIIFGLTNGGAGLLKFGICLLPLSVVLSIMFVFATIVFPNFDWIENTEIPTRKSYALAATVSSIFVSAAYGLAQIKNFRSFISVSLLLLGLALLLAFLLLKVSPTIVGNKVLLNKVQTKVKKKAAD